MKKERRARSAHCVQIGFCVLAILAAVSSPGWATSGDYDDEIKPVPVFVGLMDEEVLNLLPPGRLHAGTNGATINGDLHILGPFKGELGGTVNIEYLEITRFISVGDGAQVTIKGKKYVVDSETAEVDDPAHPTRVTFKGGGTLTVTYENGATKTLMFLHTTQAIYLNGDAPEKTQVDVDIKPDSDENVINPKSKGLIPVAVLSTDSVDATQIDPTTVDLAGAKVAVRGKGKLMAHPEDVNGDGKLDLMLQVELPSEEAAWVTGEIKLSGKTFDGEAVEGSDKITVISAEE